MIKAVLFKSEFDEMELVGFASNNESVISLVIQQFETSTFTEDEDGVDLIANSTYTKFAAIGRLSQEDAAKGVDFQPTLGERFMAWDFSIEVVDMEIDQYLAFSGKDMSVEVDDFEDGYSVVAGT